MRNFFLYLIINLLLLRHAEKKSKRWSGVFEHILNLGASSVIFLNVHTLTQILTYIFK